MFPFDAILKQRKIEKKTCEIAREILKKREEISRTQNDKNAKIEVR